MNTPSGTFVIDQTGGTVVVTPTKNLGELDFQEIEADMAAVVGQVARAPAARVVVDFHRTDYFGTTALGWFLRLWKSVRARNGGMAFCNVSPHEREILEVTKLDHLWPIYASREEALRAMSALNPPIA